MTIPKPITAQEAAEAYCDRAVGPAITIPRWKIVAAFSSGVRWERVRANSDVTKSPQNENSGNKGTEPKRWPPRMAVFSGDGDLDRLVEAGEACLDVCNEWASDDQVNFTNYISQQEHEHLMNELRQRLIEERKHGEKVWNKMKEYARKLELLTGSHPDKEADE